MIDVAACERIATLPGNPYAGVLKELCARIRELEPPPPVEPVPHRQCKAHNGCEYEAGDDGLCTPHRREFHRARDRRRDAIAKAERGELRKPPRCLLHEEALAVTTLEEPDGRHEFACRECVAMRNSMEAGNGMDR